MTLDVSPVLVAALVRGDRCRDAGRSIVAPALASTGATERREPRFL